MSMSSSLAELRQRTQLDELQSSAATTVLADLALTALTRDFRVLDKELVDLASFAFWTLRRRSQKTRVTWAKGCLYRDPFSPPFSLVLFS